MSPISHVSKCPWKFCRTLRKTSNVSTLFQTQRFYHLRISIKLAMQNSFLFINTDKLKMKSLVKWNINQRILLFNENKFISGSIVPSFYIITHFLSTWKCSTRDPQFREDVLERQTFQQLIKPTHVHNTSWTHFLYTAHRRTGSTEKILILICGLLPLSSTTGRTALCVVCV